MQCVDFNARAVLLTGGGSLPEGTIAATLEDAGYRVRVLTVFSLEQAEASFAAYVAETGPFGVLVNAGDYRAAAAWQDADRASWDAHLERNARIPFTLIQHFARALPAGAEGCVVNLIDPRVAIPDPAHLTHTVANAARWSLTRAMALALAPRIRVNAVGRAYEDDETAAARVARAVLLVLSSPSMTGQMIAPDGARPGA